MGFFDTITYLLCGVNKPNPYDDLLGHAIRQRRTLIDGSGTYIVYILDISNH